jgi:Ca2+-binding RTX toxin-like protein
MGLNLTSAQLTSALDTLAAKVSGYSEADLIKLVGDASVRVEGASAEATSLLYTGSLDGEFAYKTADALAKATAGEVGANRYVTVDQTPLGQMLKSQKFQDMYSDAVRARLLATDPVFAVLTKAEQTLKLSEISKATFSNYDPSGNRLAYNPAKLSFWDTASKRFVAEGTGNLSALLGDGVALDSVFMQTELAEAAKMTGGRQFAGMDIAQLALKHPGNLTAVENYILARAREQTKATKVSLSNLKVFIELGEKYEYNLATDANTGAIRAYINNLDPVLAARIESGYKIVIDAQNILAKAKNLNKANKSLLFLGAILIADSVWASERDGKHEEATNKLGNWGVDFLSGVAGAEIATSLATAALVVVGAGATALGVTVSAPFAAVFLVVAGIGGAYYGINAAEYFGLTSDLDNNQRADVIDRLSNLFFGATKITKDPLPADLDGNGRYQFETTLSVDYIIDKAKNDIAWRYALRELNSFAIGDVSYDKHNTDGSLDLFDSTTEKNGMTDAYLHDRAAMMTWKIRYDRGMPDDNDKQPFVNGSKPYDEDWDIDAIKGDWDFVDLGQTIAGTDRLTLSIDGAGVLQGTHQVVFGSKKSETIEGSDIEDWLYGMDGNDKITALDGNDYLEGNAGDDELSGGKGNDTLLGGTGNDTLDGGEGSDILIGGSGNDTITAGAGNDILYGNTGDDTLDGGEGNDFINGGAGKDSLTGGSGNDYLYDQGGSEATTAKGDAGNDILEVKGGAGTVILGGGDGNDILLGSQDASNSLDGDEGNDIITGGGQYDIIKGGAGADTITAGAGADRIDGGQGADYLVGGAGNDTYVYSTADFGTDLIDDSTGSLEISNGSLTGGTYDEAAMAYAGGGYEYREYKMGEFTLMGINLKGDTKNTIYIKNWQSGQFGISLSGQEENPEKPQSSPAQVTSLAGNDVDFILNNDAGDGGQGNDFIQGTCGQSVLAGGELQATINSAALCAGSMPAKRLKGRRIQAQSASVISLIGFIFKPKNTSCGVFQARHLRGLWFNA